MRIFYSMHSQLIQRKKLALVMQSKYPKEHSTVDKVRCGNLIAPEKSHFLWKAMFFESEEFESN